MLSTSILLLELLQHGKRVRLFLCQTHKLRVCGLQFYWLWADFVLGHQRCRHQKLIFYQFVVRAGQDGLLRLENIIRRGES